MKSNNSANTPLRGTLEQWRFFVAVAEHGSYAKAATALNRSQSAINHAIHRLQEQLEVTLFVPQGRRVSLSDVGRGLLLRAQQLIESARTLELAGTTLQAGIEPTVVIAVDSIYPSCALLPAFSQWFERFPQTRLELIESLLSGTHEKLIDGTAHLAVTTQPPPGFLGERLLTLRFIPVAHPDHPLHRLGRPLRQADLSAQRQIVVRDSGEQRSIDAGWLGASQRLTVSTMSTRIQALKEGLGFSWMPRLKIVDELRNGELAPLPLADGGKFGVETFLVFRDRDAAGPATLALAAALLKQAQCLDPDQPN